MELSELTAEQQAARQTITDTLLSSGWEPTVIHEMADEGQDVNFLASLEWTEGNLDLTVDYEAETSALHITFGSAWGDNLIVTVPADARLDKGLGVLVGSQATITEENMGEVIEQLRGVFPDLSVEESNADD